MKNIIIKGEIKSPNKELRIFLDNLNFAYLQFCFLEKIRENISEQIFRKNPLFWNTVRISLLRCYLSELSKIFEKQKNKFDSVLSIYYLMDFEFRGYKNTLIKLKKLRDKFLAHTDLAVSCDIEQFIKKLDLKPEEINQLFKRTYEVVAEIFSNHGFHGDHINSLYDDFKKVVVNDISEIIK